MEYKSQSPTHFTTRFLPKPGTTPTLQKVTTENVEAEQEGKYFGRRTRWWNKMKTVHNIAACLDRWWRERERKGSLRTFATFPNETLSHLVPSSLPSGRYIATYPVGRQTFNSTLVIGCWFSARLFVCFFTSFLKIVYNCIVLFEFLQWEIRVAFPWESRLRQSRAT